MSTQQQQCALHVGSPCILWPWKRESVGICYTATVCCMSHQQEQGNCREKTTSTQYQACCIQITHENMFYHFYQEKHTIYKDKTYWPTLDLLMAYCNKRSVLQSDKRSDYRLQGHLSQYLERRSSARLGHLYWSLCVYSVQQHTQTMCSTHRERFTQQVLRQIEEELLEESDPWKHSYCDK